MSLSHRNGIALTGLSAINGVSSISAINGIAATLGGGGGHPAGVLPSAIPGLSNWWKTPISGETNNVAIANWPDVFGATMSPGSAPIYKTGFVNGLDVTDWDATKKLNSTGASSVYPVTLFAMIRWDGSATAPATIFGAASNGGFQLRVENGTGALVVNKQGVANIATSTGTVPSLAWTAVVVRITSSTCDFWINGVAAGTVSHSVPITGGITFTMGYNGADDNEKYKGQLGEDGIYATTAVSDANCVLLGYGLMTKYGT